MIVGYDTDTTPTPTPQIRILCSCLFVVRTPGVRTRVFPARQIPAPPQDRLRLRRAPRVQTRLLLAALVFVTASTPRHCCFLLSPADC
jgi:hypothetical protein